jgi:glutathione peroxidase
MPISSIDWRRSNRLGVAIGMRSVLTALISLGALAAACAALVPVANIYSFKMKNIDGKNVSLNHYKGKVLLVVNVASKCGNTPQYAGLEKLYKQYHSGGLEILGFPSNDFGQQEPGTESEIKSFCTQNYGVTFPMFSKIDVKGENEHPLYKWLVASADRHDDVEWNFAKFLVGRDGKVVGRFTPRTQPDDAGLVKAIQEAMAAKTDTEPGTRY